MSRHGVIVGRDRDALLAELEARHGTRTADAVRRAQLPIGQQIAEVEQRQAEIDARRDELVTRYPQLKAS